MKKKVMPWAAGRALTAKTALGKKGQFPTAKQHRGRHRSYL